MVRRRKDGSRIEYGIYAAPEYDEHGKVVGNISVLVDLTERKQAERSLAEQIRFLQHLIDTIPSPIFYKDVNGVYLGCNQSMADFLGRPKEEIIGKTVFDIYPQEQAEKYFQKDGELFQNPGIQVYEFMMTRSDGVLRNFIFSKATFFDFSGKVAGLIGAMTDITERKRAEEAFKSLVSYAPIGIFIAQEGKLKLINPGFEKITGYAGNELLGKESLSIVAPEFQEIVRQKTTQMSMGEDFTPFEYQFLNKQGRRGWVMERVASVKFEGQRAVLGYFMDITERAAADFTPAPPRGAGI